MDRTLKNVTAVLVVTLFTALAIFATVQLTGRILGTPATASAQTAPAQTTTQTDPYGGAQQAPSYGGTDSGSTGQYVCPATGCAADSCHAAQ